MRNTFLILVLCSIMCSISVYGTDVLYIQSNDGSSTFVFGCDAGNIVQKGAVGFYLNGTHEIVGFAGKINNHFGSGGNTIYASVFNATYSGTSITPTDNLANVGCSQLSSNIGTPSNTWYNWTFSCPFNLSSGYYALVLEPQSWCPGTNHNWQWAYGTKMFLPQNGTYKSGAGSWTEFSAGNSFAHYLYGTFTGDAPILSGMNCTSCNVPIGDTSSPYTTSDTTPTFTFTTDVDASCRMARTNISYTSMGSSRDCATGQGTTSHTCTLGVADELIFADDIVYLSCVNSANQALVTDTPLQMDITGLAETQDEGLDTGVMTSSVWPGATIYEDQQIFLRNIANTQLLTTVDRVVVYGNQRWLLNFDNTTGLGLFNLTPAVYSLDIVGNLSAAEITRRVSELINTTKQ